MENQNETKNDSNRTFSRSSALLRRLRGPNGSTSPGGDSAANPASGHASELPESMHSLFSSVQLSSSSESQQHVEPESNRGNQRDQSTSIADVPGNSADGSSSSNSESNGGSNDPRSDRGGESSKQVIQENIVMADQTTIQTSLIQPAVTVPTPPAAQSTAQVVSDTVVQVLAQTAPAIIMAAGAADPKLSAALQAVAIAMQSFQQVQQLQGVSGMTSDQLAVLFTQVGNNVKTAQTAWEAMDAADAAKVKMA